MRVGGFANDSSWRGQAGAGFYGVMNLSDNVWERCVEVHTAEGRDFVPVNGDGRIRDDNARANVSEWITISPKGQNILRGFQTSDRRYVTMSDGDKNLLNGTNERHPATGGRLAITITPALED